jgi:hypothetical protein
MLKDEYVEIFIYRLMLHQSFHEQLSFYGDRIDHETNKFTL